MTKLYSLLLACSILFLYSCKSASKSYKKRDYTEAIERGVKKLQKDQADYETRDLVQQSYNYSVAQHEDEIRILSLEKARSICRATRISISLRRMERSR